MVGRTVNFNEVHPDSDAGHAVLEARLKEVRVQMDDAAAVQRAGLIDVHTSALEKRRLRREKLAGPIAHVSEVGRLAAKDHPELVGKLRYRPSGTSFLAHRTAAASMLAEAKANKEVLAKYGLSEAVLEVFEALLDQFDAAVKLGSDGRGKHKGATQRLTALAQEGGRIVRAMDARNRYRFKDDEQLLGAWTSASTVHGRAVTGSGSGPAEPPAGGTGPGQEQVQQHPGEEGGPPVAGGDVRPAA
ncbi:MAG TPA: hypothetical protein VJQ46_10400 [Gemmatimonadales bacterium]|nr:hypothetical protein [Gemmatimonadales bacterium]